MIKNEKTTGLFRMGSNGSNIFCALGAVLGSLIEKDQIKAVNAIHNNIIGKY